MTVAAYEAGLPLWTISSKYLSIVSRTASEIANRGNPSGVLSNYPLRPEDIDKRTEWSDTNLSVPILFNFYHGLEVMMKGFLVAEGQRAQGHKLSKLLTNTRSYHPNAQVFKLIDSYIDQSKLESPLKEFFSENNINPDSFYEVFKYPETMKGKSITHTHLKYGGSKSANFYRTLADDAEKICKQSAKLANSCYS